MLDEEYHTRESMGKEVVSTDYICWTSSSAESAKAVNMIDRNQAFHNLDLQNYI